jgi:hypothetical protein
MSSRAIVLDPYEIPASIARARTRSSTVRLETLCTYASMTTAPEPPERFPPTVVPSLPPLDLDLRSGEIRTFVWATGYSPGLS